MKLEDLLDSTLITALATGLLVIVGFAQVIVLIAQKKQTRLQLVTEYRKRWNSYQKYWGKVVFIGRNEDEFYQVLNEKKLQELNNLKKITSHSQPTIWAKESIQIVCGTLSEISVRILNDDLKVSDAYSIFGSEFLRHSKPLRVLLDNEYKNYDFESNIQNEH